MSRKLIFVLLVVALLSAACSGQPASGAAAKPTFTPTPVAPIAPSVNGKLAPRQFVELSLKSSGIVAEVLVSEGDSVAPGQALARLDDTLLKLAVEEARMKAGQASLELDKAKKPADPAELAAAEQAVKAAQAALSNAIAGAPTTSDTAKNRLRTAQLAFDYAQADYNHQLDLKGWGFDVEVKTDALQTAKVRYENAQSELLLAQRDATGSATRAWEPVVQAQKTLAQAQAEYEALKARPEAEDVRTAQLAFQAAQMGLSRAEAELADATLVATMAGVVAEVQAKAGESVAAGAPLITLADTAQWFVETEDLTEVSIIGVEQGLQVLCKFDAVPGLALPAHVERIALRGQDQRGDVLYRVRVALDQVDNRLRWGMTAFVQFEKDAVLRVNVPGSGVAPTVPEIKGNIAPAKFVELGMGSGGVVAEVPAQEGQRVEAGQVLVRLNDKALKLAVEEAQLKVNQAQLDLDKAQKPADPADIAAADKAVQAAQASLTTALGGRSTTIEQAASAQRSAELAVQKAERSHAKLLEYKSWGFDVEDPLKRSQVELDNLRTQLEIARRDAANAGTRAQQPIAQAQQTLADAQAKLQMLKQQPEPETVRAAELALQAAQLALGRAQADVKNAQLTAPIAGLVTEVKVKAGQQVAAGAPIVTMADTSAWLVETINLSELSVAGVGPDTPMTVRLEALPGLTFPGHVERIAIRSQDQHGEVTYPARIVLDHVDPRVRWGMTAFAQIRK